MGIIVSLLVISFLIFFHELGHFLAARFFNVKVDVFSIGFGKKIFKKQWGDTEYAISAIPLGGYVQMKGQDDSDPTKTNYDEDGYGSKPPWQRIIILFAGPFANFLLAFILYMAVGYLGVAKLAPQIGKISENSAGFIAGLEVNDTIISINGEGVAQWDDIKPLVTKSNSTLSLKIKRDETFLLKSITPKIGETKNIFGETIQQKLIGIMPSGKRVTLYFSGFSGFEFAYNETYNATKFIFLGLQKLIEGVVSPKEMGGIISIVKYTSDAANMGIVVLFILTALISVNLGVINLFPIPALDGGHIMFNLYEMVAKKPPSQKVYVRFMYAGWVFLLFIMIFTIINDILRLTGSYQ